MHCERCNAAIETPAKLAPWGGILALLVGVGALRPSLCEDCAGLYNVYAIIGLVSVLAVAFVVVVAIT